MTLKWQSQSLNLKQNQEYFAATVSQSPSIKHMEKLLKNRYIKRLKVFWKRNKFTAIFNLGFDQTFLPTMLFYPFLS